MMGYGKGVGGAQKGGQYYRNNNFQMNDMDYGDDDDMDDYGDQYYAEEDSEDMGGQNYPPGALFQGQKAGGPMSMGAMGGGLAGMGAGGVPFYGQQQQFGAPSMAGYGGYGQMGAMGAMGQMAPTTSGGGFTYGMASKGGNLFGAPATTGPAASAIGGGTQFGASAASTNPGLFQFGKISQMGGLGGGSTFAAGASPFAAGSSAGLFGAAAENDPYANIAIDLNKVKKQEAPAKLYEHKTEEEKKKEAKTTTSAATKSNLKKEAEEKKKTPQDKRGVTFGKSTTYEVERESDQSTDGFNKDNLGDGRGSPRLDKKVVAEKDLGDGRTEKEKILEMLEKQQREQMEEIEEMNEWKSKAAPKTADTTKSGSESTKIEVQRKEPEKKAIEGSNSYESDDFEDASISGSGSKTKVNFWAAGGNKKSADSVSISASQSKDKDDDSYDPKAMEAYMKKQQLNSISKPATTTAKPAVVTHDQSESSDRYDDDFESMSKSQTNLTSSMLQSPHQIAAQPSQTVKAITETKPQVFEYKSVADQYKKKENKFIQTDEGKYNFIEPSEALKGTSNFKEWTLQKNLKDAEELIQELRTKEAELKDQVVEIELKMKKKEVEFHTQRREALNANETSKRLQEQLKDAVHKINLYKIETEELIKQIDLADAKTRNKEDDLKLLQAEYERKMKLQEERILFRVSKQEERETVELKRQHFIEKDELQRKIETQQEELDYLNTKILKIEAENKQLRTGRESNKKIKELEDELELVKYQLSTQQSQQYQALQENLNLKNLQKELSKEDQVKLQRELSQLEIMVRGYQEENEKAMQKQKQLERELKQTSEKLVNEQKRAKDLHQKNLLNTDKVYVEEQKEELDIQTVNNMGLGNAISQKQLQEMHDSLQRLQAEKLDFERDMSIKEGQLKSQIQKLRDEKSNVEKQLYDTEFLLGDKEKEIQKLKEELSEQRKKLTGQIDELEEKVAWFRQNQRILTEEDQQKAQLQEDNAFLKDKVKKLEEDVKRTKDLEKKCKLLEETIKSKNPNSIPMLIQASKEAQQQSVGNTQDKERIQDLERQLADQDREFEKKLRALRQEQERLKQLYENKAGLTPDAKRVRELEEELQKTKQHYNKRIREVEDKYKFGNHKPPAKQTKEVAQKVQQDQILPPPAVDVKHFEQQIEQLTKERNLLAQKLVNAETINNKRRQSFSGVVPQDDKSAVFAAIRGICNLLKLQKDSKEAGFSLIEAALSCVEQLRQKDPQKNNILSQHLLQLTQDLNSQGRINEKVLTELITLCENETKGTTDLRIKHMNSVNVQSLNKDLSNVFNPFAEEDSKVKENKSPSKPPKPSLHPFVVNASQPKRTTKDILKQIVQSGIDFERVVKERGMNPKKLQVNQIYQILREESDDEQLRSITVDEVKRLIQVVKEKSSDDFEVIGVANDEVDVLELVNVIMDVSLDIFGKDNEYKDESILQQANRYSQDPILRQQPVKGSDDTQGLRDEISRLRDDQSIWQSKIERLQKLVQDLNNEKKDLMDKLDKLESSKLRVERILKQSASARSTMRKTKDGAAALEDEIYDELAVLMKRIEFLEQQSEEREKMTNQGHGPCRREITRLQQDLESERIDKQRMLQKKNSEVAYFKAELDSLLNEMKSTMINKQQRQNKF